MDGGLSSKLRIVIAVSTLPLKCMPEQSGAIDTYRQHAHEEDSGSICELIELIPKIHEIYVVGRLGCEGRGCRISDLSGVRFGRWVCVPLSDNECSSVAEHFTRTTLVPLCHGIPPNLDGYHSISDEWKSYAALNLNYAEKVVPLVDDNTIVWVRDNLLMLLPNEIRMKTHDAKVILSVDMPFPSLEIFQSLEVRDELLIGVLGSDMVSFYSGDHGFHFLDCCRKLLGLSYQSQGGDLSINFYGRVIMIKIIPFMLDWQKLADVSPITPEWAKNVGNKNRGRVTLLSIDNLSWYSGIELKLQAMDDLLHRGYDVMLVLLVMTPSRLSNDEEVLVEKIEEMKLRINEKYEENEDYVVVEPVIIRWYKDTVGYEERSYCYSIADCLLITAVMDSVYTAPFEFAVNGAGKSMIISENISGASFLRGVIRVNPWNIEDLMDALILVIDGKRKLGHEANLGLIKMVEPKIPQILEEVNAVGKDYLRRVSIAIGEGLKGRKVFGDSRFVKLVNAHKQATRRLVLIEYDDDRVRGKELSGLVEYFIDDGARIVVASKFSDLPGELIARATYLIIEDGYQLRSANEEIWKKLEGIDADWLPNIQSDAKNVLENLSVEIPGSSIETYESSLVWHFTESPLVSLIVDEAIQVLSATESITTERGLNSLRVKPKGVSKGAALQMMVREMGDWIPDFALHVCLGSSSMGSDLEKVAQELVGKEKFHKVQVHPCPTMSGYYVNNIEELKYLLSS